VPEYLSDGPSPTNLRAERKMKRRGPKNYSERERSGERDVRKKRGSSGSGAGAGDWGTGTER
jgi:hypothetical protein